MLAYAYTPYALIAVASLMFTLPATAYLLWLRPKTTATYNLIGFLVCIILSLAVMYLYNAAFYFFHPLWPLQDFLVIVGTFFLVRFAYAFPHVERSVEARMVTGFFFLWSALALGWVLTTGWDFLVQPHAFQIADAYWLKMPLAILLTVGVFLRRMVVLARVEANRSAGFWSALRRPPTRAAAAHRSFALATFTGLIQAFGSVAFPYGISHVFPAATFIGLGTLLTISLLLLAYLNATAPQSTLIVKMVGASMIVLLAVLGGVGIQVLNTSLLSYQDFQEESARLVVQHMLAGDTVVYPLTLAYVADYPLTAGLLEEEVELVHRNPHLPALRPSGIQAIIARNPLDAEDHVNPDKILGVTTRADRFSLGTGAYYDTFAWVDGGRILEFGFVDDLRNPASHILVSRLIGQIMLGSLLVLLVLPVFFRRSLTIPLNQLLGGVKQVMGGDLHVAVPIMVDDEIGFLTRSFNSMAASLLELNEGLEQKVADRTQALSDEIVERRRVQSQLELAKVEAEEANRAKSVFLANMSHELRTPLNAILGYAQVLQQYPEKAHYPERDERPAFIIERSGRHLLTLINEILDLAKIESGKNVLHPHDVALAQFLEGTVEMGRVPVQAKGLAFLFDNQIRAEAVVRVDATRLRQVLLNLLGNAAAYTDAGAVTLRVEEGAATSGSGTFHFSVEDTGIGIAAHELASVTEPFFQTESARERGGGTGLGLSVSRQLIELMGGRLMVESQPGQGSAFSFSLDLPLISAEGLEQSDSAFQPFRLLAGPSPRILVVDDNADNRRLLADMLGPLGFDVVSSPDAARGLQLARTQPFAAVITDLVMPKMDGFALIRALRNEPATAAALIVATSASVFPEDETRSIEVGADGFLPKPIELRRLLQLLDERLHLVWRDQVNESTTVEGGEELSIPGVQNSPEQLAKLLRFAQAGDVVALRREADLLAQQAGCDPFTTQLRAYTQDFEMRKLAKWLASLQPTAES